MKAQTIVGGRRCRQCPIAIDSGALSPSTEGKPSQGLERAAVRLMVAAPGPLALATRTKHAAAEPF
jgi:hypothetical protein